MTDKELAKALVDAMMDASKKNKDAIHLVGLLGIKHFALRKFTIQKIAELEGRTEDEVAADLEAFENDHRNYML